MSNDAQQLLHEAFRIHQAGQYREAEFLYRRVLQHEPASVDGHHLLGLVMHESGRHEEAAEHIRAAIDGAPAQDVLFNSLGVALMAMPRLEAAEIEFRRAIELAPGNREAHLNLGVCLYQAGRAAEAWPCFEQAVALSPDWAYARLRYGLAQSQAGNSQEALGQLRRAAELDHGCLESRLQLGKQFLAAQDFAAAQHWFEQVVQLVPEHLDALLSLARIAERQRRLDLAVQYCVRLLKIRGDIAPAHLMLGVILSSRLKPEYRLKVDLEERNSLIGRALEHLELASKITPSAESFDAYGVGLMRAGRHAEAIERFRLAQEHDRSFAPSFEHLGKALLEIGRTEEAKTQFTKAIGLNPSQALSHYELAQIHTSEEDGVGAFSRQLEQLLTGQEPAPAQVLLHFALARRYERAGRFDEAFDHFDRGGRIKSDLRTSEGERGRSLDATDALIDQSIELFDRGFFESRKGWGVPSQQPVFIVGMPRSGTSLMEQILASHGQVHGAGELIDISDLCLSLSRRLSSDRKYPEAVNELTGPKVGELAEEYLAVLQGHSRDARYVTDKMPTNFRYLAMIALLLPQAKIVHMRRDPLDVCVSCFRQNLEWPFCELRSVGHYYRSYDRLMRHWHRVLPSEILDVQYEGLVGDQQAETRRVLTFLGLGWDDRCLDFQSTERPVQTPSKWQVRQPIYASSVGLWRRYERHLAPLKQILSTA